MKTVGLIIADNVFRDEEYFEPKKVLDNAGIKTITIGKTLDICNGKLGAKVVPDMEIKNVQTDNFDAIAFIGGVGCKIYFEDEIAHKICKEMVEKNKIIAGICSAVGILAMSGILNGKNANSHQTERETLAKNGAILKEDDIVIDGNIISSTGPKVARGFGEAILQKLRQK